MLGDEVGAGEGRLAVSSLKGGNGQAVTSVATLSDRERICSGAM